MRCIIVLFAILLVVTGTANAQWGFDWDYTFHHTGSYGDEVEAMAIDPWGNVLINVSSRYSDYTSSVDIVTIKLNPLGDTLWARVFDGDSTDISTDIDVDAGGNIYITAWTWDIPLDMWRPLVIKYLPNGDTAWTRRPLYPTGQPMKGMFFEGAFDNSGNFVATGNAREGSAPTMSNILVVKYAPDGSTIWQTVIDLDPNTHEHATKIVIDDLDQIYLTGRRIELGGSAVLRPLFAICLSGGGTNIWTGEYYAPDAGNHLIGDIAVDEAANLYLVGTAKDSLTANYYFLVIKFDKYGDVEWDKLVDGGVELTAIERAYGVEIDAAGNPIVVGQLWPSAPQTYDIYLVKYTPAGVVIWDNYYDSGEWDMAMDMALDPSGNIFVTGYSYNASPDFDSDMLTLVADSGGNWIWSDVRDWGSDFDDRALHISLDTDNNIYVAGSYALEDGSYPDMSAAVVKYSWENCCVGIRGDVNGDGADLDIVDLTCIVDFLFGTGCDMPCPEEADVNGDGASADIVDLTFVVDYLFGETPKTIECP